MGYLLYKIHFCHSCCGLTNVATQKNEHLKIVMLCVGPQLLTCVTYAPLLTVPVIVTKSYCWCHGRSVGSFFGEEAGCD